MAEITRIISTETDDLPCFFQGSGAPAFRGDFETGEQLKCVGCGNILVGHYAKDEYVSVRIRCNKCFTITQTPSLLLGEVFADPVASIGQKGIIMLGSTFNKPSGVIITCDQEIRREIEATAPRGESLPLIISEDGLNCLVRTYNEIAGDKFSVQKKTIERQSNNIGIARKFPFAWAIAHLENCLKRGPINPHQSDTFTAMMWLSMFCNVIGTWQHHPRFKVVARDMGKPDSFLHTSSQLIAAAYLFRLGNRIGLSLEDQPSESNPDLYIRGTGTRRNIFIEVKAPQSLQWCADSSPKIAENTKNAVKNCIDHSRRQINRSHPGVLIISSSFIGDNLSSMLEESIQGALRLKFRYNKYLAAVVNMSPIAVRVMRQGDMTFSCEFNFGVTLNPHYDGNNPILTTPISL
ncbi:MAG: hypothetical protein HQL37_12135 [Alphaproteobacteria bacterium]|nr:hypothetical protein [Alphaproteobacteria bacterium]